MIFLFLITIFNKNSNKNNIQNIFDNKYKSSNKKNNFILKLHYIYFL